MQSPASRIRKTASTLGAGAALALACLGANAQMTGSTMQAKFYYPDLSSVDSDSGVLTIANGASFAFSDTIGFGTSMLVTFGDSQIRLTNLIPGICPESEFTGNPGESIYLDVAAVPEPTTMALLGAGLAAIAWRRRKVV